MLGRFCAIWCEPNRRTVPYRDFTTSEGTDDDQKAGAKGFVDLFIQERLLVADTDPQGEVTVSVVHEALLREWQRIREWLKENREFLRMRDRLDSSLKLWLPRLALAAVEKALLADPMDKPAEHLRLKVLTTTPER
ncbi:MAG: hypothetical protein JO232_01720 [Verrucomicrobia bacterium]|nr:hypothetical protein [Verrucomicrobiota bacterium]